MVEITAMTYEQVRSKYFEEQMQKAQRRMKYWEARIDRTRPDNLMDEAHCKAADAGWEYNFYKDALQAMAAQPKWISVKEKLPENDYNYLVFTSDRNDAVIATYYGDGEWLEYDSTNLIPLVTHWMPLPEPPKEDA